MTGAQPSPSRQELLLAAFRHAGLGARRRQLAPPAEDFATALDVLGWLSENVGSGADCDDIAAVRHLLDQYAAVYRPKGQRL